MLQVMQAASQQLINGQYNKKDVDYEITVLPTYTKYMKQDTQW